MKNKVFRTLSVTLSLLLFLGLTAIPAILPGSPGGVYAKATDEGFRGIRLSTLEVYNKFIDNPSILPKNFVTMDMLKSVGTFGRFLIYDRSDLYRYEYELILGNGLDICFQVNAKPLASNKDKQISKTALGSNMIKLKTNDSGIYISSGITYHYVKGSLLCMEWESHGTVYCISASRTRLSEFPYPSGNTFMDLLLSTAAEDQKAAMEMLPDQIGDAKQITTEIMKPIGTGIVCIAIFAAYIFIRHRHRKPDVK